MKKYVYRIDPQLPLIGFCDTYEHNWGGDLLKGLECWSKDLLNPDQAVLIAIEAQPDIALVCAEMDAKGIDYCHIFEAAEAYQREWELENIKLHDEKLWEEPTVADGKIAVFLDCYVPYTLCNLRCSYCYIRQVREFEQVRLKLHSPDFVRRAFSKKRLGGTAFINFCAGGETLYVEELLPIAVWLVKEGHYVQIVTNGTLTRAFDELLNYQIDFEHIFIKFSFHYMELLRTGKMDVFFFNVHKMRKAGCSITVELVPHDNLIPYIEEIKQCCLKNIGALPHLTIPRDDREKDLRIITDLDMDEYRKIWGQFDSKLFEYKNEILYVHRDEYCMAGVWALEVNLETGDIFQCVHHPYIDNLYDNISQSIQLKPVGRNCRLPYCYNGHAYLTWGVTEQVSAPTYNDVRDRAMLNGQHWVTEKMQAVMNQKLYDNHKSKFIIKQPEKP